MARRVWPKKISPPNLQKDTKKDRGKTQKNRERDRTKTNHNENFSKMEKIYKFAK